jgi:hypothetical protein
MYLAVMIGLLPGGLLDDFAGGFNVFADAANRVAARKSKDQHGENKGSDCFHGLSQLMSC